MDCMVGGKGWGITFVCSNYIQSNNLRMEASGGILDQNLSDFKMWLSLTALACQYLLCMCVCLHVY